MSSERYRQSMRAAADVHRAKARAARIEERNTPNSSYRFKELARWEAEWHEGWAKDLDKSE